jgi:integrase
MPKRHLTDTFVRSRKANSKRIEYYDQHLIENNDLKAMGVKGLLLRVTKAGNKYWYYSYWYDGQSKRYKIGDYPNVGISDARDKAKQLADQVNDGIDPQAEKNAKKNKAKPKKFEYLVNQFKKKHLPTLKESTQRTYTERIDGEMIPAFKGMAIQNISRGVIIELLEEILERGSPYQSNRVRAILSSMFSFGVQREIAEYNPVKTIKPLGNEEKRERVLDEDEIKELWEGFGRLPEPTGSLFKVLLTLGQRLGETRRMRWDNIEEDVWTIPKENTKANRKHFMPLTPTAKQIIDRLENDSPYVFESYRKPNKPLKSVHGSFNRLAEDLGINDIRIHDLRRSAATYMAELGTDRTILGKVLNHKGLAGDTQVTARYDRHGYIEEKRTALNRWSHKLQQIISGEETKTNVTKIA